MAASRPDIYADGPVAALRRIAFLLERSRAETYKVKAFRAAAATILPLEPDEVASRVREGTLRELPGIGASTAEVIAAAVEGRTPDRLARLEEEVGGTLVDGTGLVSNHQFYLVAQPFLADQPAIVQAILAALVEADHWGAANPTEVAALIGPRMGIPVPVLQVALERMGYGVQPLADAVVAEQQKIADTFYGLGLLPKPINVRDAVAKVSV